MIYIIYELQRVLFEYMLKLLYYSHMCWLYIINIFNVNYESSVIYIKDNKIIYKEEEKPDYFVKIYKNEKNKNVIKISDDFDILTSEEIKICNYNFILVLLKIFPITSEEHYQIDITNILKNNNISYYAEEAILFNYNFYSWLIIKHFNKLGVIDIQGVDLIDQYADHISITHKQYIKLKLDEYSICEYKE